MSSPNLTMAQQVAQAARDFQQEQTGHAPQAVSVVLNGEMLVITLHEALSPAAKVLAQTPAGAAQIREFHQQLFLSSVHTLREKIKTITGVEVLEATAEIETTTGAVVQVFTTGTVVQVFLLNNSVPTDTWSETESLES